MTDTGELAWGLRYAPHLGYVPPDRLLFVGLAGAARSDHVHFAAKQGFAGVLNPWVGDHSVEERSSIAAALRETGLVSGSIVTLPQRRAAAPLWVTTDSITRSELIKDVKRSIDIACQMRSKVLAVLLAGDPANDRDTQKRVALDRLVECADLAAEHGLSLAIEPMIRLPNMLLRTFAEGIDLIERAQHPALGLIYDTAHCCDMGEDPLEALVAGYDRIVIAQLADAPGRVEPGAGNIPFIPILSELMHRGFDGLVELEFNWSSPNEQAELAGLKALAALDAQAQAACRHRPIANESLSHV